MLHEIQESRILAVYMIDIHSNPIISIVSSPLVAHSFFQQYTQMNQVHVFLYLTKHTPDAVIVLKTEYVL